MIDLKKEINGDLNIDNFSINLFLKSYFFNPAFRLLLNHRTGKYFFYKKGKISSLIAAFYKSRMVSRRACDFSYKSQIGRNLILPHPKGIVIGDGVIINDDVKIFQHVTLGSHGKKEQSWNILRLKKVQLFMLEQF